MPRSGVRGFSPATLRRLRTTAEFSLDELGDLAGVSAQSLSAWENGKSVPSARVLAAVAGALRVTVADLAPLRDSELVLRDLRSQAGLTQADVAAALDIGKTRSSDIERGRRVVDDDLVHQLATLYRVPDDLVRQTWVRTCEQRWTRLRNR